MAEIMVGLWSVPHGSSWKLSPMERIFNLSKALERLEHAAQSVTEPKPKPDHWFRAIFMAPEYYFSAKSSTTPPKREPLSDDARLTLEAMLFSLSRHYPDVLIIPGSVFYVKEIMRSADPRAKFKIDPFTGLRTKPKVTAPDRRDRFGDQLYKAAVAADARGHQFAVDKGMVLLKGEHQARVFNPATMSVAQIAQKVPSLVEDAEALETKNPKVARNAVFMLLGGGRVSKYDKHTDFFEADSALPDDLVFLPGTKDQCPVIGGFRFGVEVCFDHANGVLLARKTDPIDFHLVVSDYTENTPANMAMAEHGYFLHASTNHAKSSVWWLDGGTPKDATKSKAHIAEEQCGGGVLDVFRLPAPPPRGP